MSVFADGKKTERGGRSLCRSVSEDMHGVREADVARREATQDMSTAQRDVRLVLRENPPSRLANRRGFFGGQSGEVGLDASISFGFLGVCSFAVFPSG